MAIYLGANELSTGGGGGGTPINGIAELANVTTQYTDLDGSTWLKAGFVNTDIASYPDAEKVGISPATAALDQTIILSNAGNVSGITFKPDGTRFFTTDSSNKITEYSLSTPWDLSTFAKVQEYNTAAHKQDPTDLTFSQDGTRLFVTGQDPNDYVAQYSLSTAWDIGTITGLEALESVGRYSYGICFSPDGLNCFIGEQFDVFEQIWLTEPWDLRTKWKENQIGVGSTGGSGWGLSINSTGNKIYNIVNGIVYERTLSQPFDINTISSAPTNTYGNFGGSSVSTLGLYFNENQTEIYTTQVNSPGKANKFNVTQGVGLVNPVDLGSYSYIKIK